MLTGPTESSDLASVSDRLVGDIRSMIEETRAGAAATVNAGLTVLHWSIGKRMNDEILHGKQAGSTGLDAGSPWMRRHRLPVPAFQGRP